MTGDLIDMRNYDSVDLTFYIGCAAIWLVAYILIIINIRKHQFAAIPAAAMSGYIAWEILWGYVYTTDMGTLFVWGLKIYAPVSCYIVYYCFKRSDLYFFSPVLKRHSRLALAGAFLGWFAVLYFFIPAVDDGAGITTAIILITLVSAQYIPLLLKLYEEKGALGLEMMVFPVAWLKLFANASGTIFCFVHLPERHWLHALGIVAVCLDVVYLLIFRQLRQRVGAAR